MKLICKCTNTNCKDYQKEREIEWDGQSSMQLHLLLNCPLCSQKRITKDTKIDNVNKLTTIFSPQIDSMTPAERKALLKKRSTIDYHKNIEARAREMDKNVIPR